MSDICRICGFPTEQHAVELRFGVAHTVVRGVDGKALYSCSMADCDRHYTLGELRQKLHFLRSLRWRAGRARTSGQAQRGDALAEMAYKAEAEHEKLLIAFRARYPWAKE